jgi:hypothetical protein
VGRPLRVVCRWCVGGVSVCRYFNVSKASTVYGLAWLDSILREPAAHHASLLWWFIECRHRSLIEKLCGGSY